MGYVIVIAQHYALAIVHNQPYASRSPGTLVAVLEVVGGRSLECACEVHPARAVITEHLVRHHPWLSNCPPPKQAMRQHGNVALLCWVNEIEERHGPTVAVPQLDGSTLPRCEHHTT